MKSKSPPLASADVPTEGDVELKVILPILTSSQMLGYPSQWIKSKDYMQPTDIDKGHGKKIGYYPDFSVWLFGLPVLIVEAKKPTEDVFEGLREARLYAAELNKRYPPGVNPLIRIASCNGKQFVASSWDSELDLIDFDVADLNPGTAAEKKLKEFLSKDVFLGHAQKIVELTRPKKLFQPISFLGGAKVLDTPLGLNSFAKDIFPLVQMFLTSDSPEREDDIIRRAYVASDEVTQYTQTLETYLKDNLLRHQTVGRQEIRTSRHAEPAVTKEIQKFVSSKGSLGHLQLLIGPRGSGKSIFTKRYFRHLVPADLRKKILVAFINFNNAPEEMSGIETWVCQQFVDSLVETNSLESIYDRKNLDRIFAPELNKLRGAYVALQKTQPNEYEKRVADDFKSWLQQPERLAASLARYYSGERNMPIVVVFDNVDKRDRDQQLKIFSIAQWFKGLTRCFCMLTLRDETFEAFKSEPPLDAFTNAVNFFISPPRFTDVVKKRLELVIEYLAGKSEKTLSYDLPNGARIVYPSSDLGRYLTTLFLTLFHRRTQLADILEALSGRDVRRALQMFIDIIVSKHLSEREITSVIRGGLEFDISEATLIKILMRTRYKYFSREHGYISDIFIDDGDFKKFSNFILIELLEILMSKSKTRGDLGIQGYFFLSTIIDHMQSLGFHEDDVAKVANYALESGLVTADHQRTSGLTTSDAIRIHASGVVHLRFLARRYEYLSAVLPVTYFTDESSARRISTLWELREDWQDIGPDRKLGALDIFLEYLSAEYDRIKKNNVYFERKAHGSRHAIEYIQKAINWARVPQGRSLDKISDIFTD